MDNYIVLKKIGQFDVRLDNDPNQASGLHWVEVSIVHNTGAWSAKDGGYPYELCCQLNGQNLGGVYPKAWIEFEDLGVYGAVSSKKGLDEALKVVAPSKRFVHSCGVISNYRHVLERLFKRAHVSPVHVEPIKCIRHVMGVEVYEDRSGFEFVAQPNGLLLWSGRDA